MPVKAHHAMYHTFPLSVRVAAVATPASGAGSGGASAPLPPPRRSCPQAWLRHSPLPFPCLPTLSELKVAATEFLGATPHEAYGWLLRPACRAACYGATTCLALDLPFNWAVVSALFSSAYLAYAYDRLKDATNDGDHANRSKRTLFMARHAPAIQGTMVAAVGFLVAASSHLPASFAAGLWPSLAIALLYAAPILPGGMSLRTAPGGKTLTTNGLWAFQCAWLPVAAAGGLAASGASRAALAAMLLHVACCCLGSIFKDLGDLACDAADGTRSLPVLLGKQRTLRLIVSLCALDAVVSLLVLRQPALLIPNALLVAHALTYDSRRFERVEENSFYLQLGLLALMY